MNKDIGTILCFEFPCDSNDKTWNADQSYFFNEGLSLLKDMDIVGSLEPQEHFILKVEHIYPVYKIGFGKNLLDALKYFKGIKNLFPIGRQGIYDNNTTVTRCFQQGWEVAEFILTIQKEFIKK